MKKKSVWGAIAVLSALYMVRAGFKIAGELRRYNHILSLSDEGTVRDEFPELMMQIVKAEKRTIMEWVDFMKSAPSDAVRYMKMQAM